MNKNSKSVATPGIREEGEVDTQSELLPRDQGTQYRAVVARGLYLTQDRSDIGYAVKELSRWMSRPTQKD